ALNKAFSDRGSWYLIGLGALALVMSLAFRQGLWGGVQRATGWSVFPVQRRLAANQARKA
ncbi:MAG TPA: hypothetical protein VLJ58_19535, partial [Ramlibacter sp.]|nr:hypothetical protein [Ramlibacter sp.]